MSGCGYVVLIGLLFAQQFEYEAVKTVILRYVFLSQLSVTVPAELNLPRITPEPGIPIRDPFNSHASGSLAITAQPDNVTIIGEVIMVTATNIHLLRYRGDEMAAGSTNEPPFPEVLILFVLKERRPLLQVGQVIYALFRGVFS